MGLSHGGDPQGRTVLREVEGMAAGSPLLEDLAPVYFRHVPGEDLEARRPADLLGAMVSHVELASDRPPGTARVRVHTPTEDADGWSCGGPVVEIVTDDMPFLVDSVAAELTRLGRSLRLVIHPVLSVQRDVTGALQGVAPDGAGTRESWIHAEISRGGASAAEIENSLRRVLSDVRESVEDWPRMRAEAIDTANQIQEHPPAGIAPDQAAESAALLRWAAARLHGFASLGLVVTVGNDAALRAYERVGFTIESTARTLRLP